MASTLLFFVLLVTVVVEPIVLGIPVTDNGIDEPCEAELWENDAPYECSAVVSVRGECVAATLHLDRSKVSKLCTSVSLFWSYPVDNLTITIETPFTQKQQAYTLEFDNEQIMSYISHVYRFIDGKETEVTTHDSKLIQHSDSKYQIILKLEGPPTLTYYGVFVHYNVTQS